MPALHFSRPTRKDKLKVETLHAINSTMSSVAGDTPTLLAVVAGGPAEWRNRFMSVTRGLAVNEDVADKLFAFFANQVVKRYGRELSAGKLLDSLEVISPPTDKEIADSWEVESSSSEEGRRFFYGPDGHPEELIKKLVQN
jgi:hypothetical protein